MHMVVPLAGTWIETVRIHFQHLHIIVVPLAGTWIETVIFARNASDCVSFPLRERGLKLLSEGLFSYRVRRSPCGNVD